MYTSGIEANLRAHLAAKVTEMTTFSTAATTLDEVEARQTAFNTLRDELLINDWGTDIMNFFGIADEYRTEVNEVNYIIVPDAVDRIFTQINSGYTSISFDESIVQDKQREIDEARNSFARDFEVQITPLSDVTNVTEV